MLTPKEIEEVFRKMGLSTEEERSRVSIKGAHYFVSEKREEQLFIRIQSTTCFSEEKSDA